MRIFSIHARSGEKPRTRLVPEGFSVWAFLFGPLWLLWRGLWLALLGYVLLAAGSALLPAPWDGWAGIALQLLLGLHARDLERWTLQRRGFAHQGVVAAQDEDEALLRAIRAKPLLARGAMA
ncbi:DUF2628 domain-containing protein [Roseomonas chloroacetimidivorans]|jgi:hypothetical protein|uniref:DUF2628 domain-containing protein n=1 Tax=Roseomonas chloroacetimidivorans TaxID=1766656 RepID=UPI003C7414FF